MNNNQYMQAKRFYQDVVRAFSDRFPVIRERNIGFFKVIHCFDDKLPMLEVLLEEGLLLGAILKKSSSEAQIGIAQQIESLLEKHDLLMSRSDTTYANAVPKISGKVGNRPFIVGDHGGYYAHALHQLRRRFNSQMIGITEHTLNGEERVLRQFDRLNLGFRYFSTARSDLKERSDRDIAHAIAQEIVATTASLGRSILNESAPIRILLIGYGVMGQHIGKRLSQLGNKGEVLISDISPKKIIFAVQDGHQVTRNIEDVLPSVDIVILATSAIRGKKPALEPKHFSMLKDEALITSVTSLDDEANHNELIDIGIIHRVGFERDTGVYKGPTGKIIYLANDGKPANVGLQDGGAKEGIYLVEAAGIVGGFMQAQANVEQTRRKKNLPLVLDDEIADAISSIWLKNFHPEIN
jgi:adenosylhomocysteinase